MRHPAGHPACPRFAMVWMVLAGLFLMHGAASPSGGCDSAPVTALMSAAMPAVPAVSADLSASTMSASPVRHTLALPGAPSAMLHGGMLCSALQPRNSLDVGACASPASSVSVPAPALAGVAAVAGRAGQPPGKPGLPLPLFLGVSRT